ncbi:MAG: hypothetical protein Kow00124_30830 [Anaerolineae bacterium]
MRGSSASLHLPLLAALITGMGVLLAACGAAGDASLDLPADRPALLFFYTEN